MKLSNRIATEKVYGLGLVKMLHIEFYYDIARYMYELILKFFDIYRSFINNQNHSIWTLYFFVLRSIQT